MAKLLKLRRGTTTQHSSFTGAEGEVTVDTDKESLVVHNGSNAGGYPLAREDMSNVSSASIAGRLATDSIAPAKIGAGTLPTDVTVASANIVDGTIAAADLATTGVTAGAYGSSSAIPIVTVNNKGQVTAASTTAIDSTTIANGSASVAVSSNGPITSNANHDFSAGIDVTGNITVSGTVDGRDVAADGTKLDTYQANGSAYVRSDASDTLTGNTYTLSGSVDEKLVLSGTSNPYIRWQEGTTNKAYIQWHSDGMLLLWNSEESRGIKISGIPSFYDGSGYQTMWHAGNDGAGSGLDADSVDGIAGSSFLRSDAQDTAAADITFDGGAGAVTINANSDIRLSSGSWTGDAAGKIQHHNNILYFQGGSSGFAFLSNGGTGRWTLNADGHFVPNADSTYDIGTNSTRVRNLYADTLYGDGSNLTGVQPFPSGTKMLFQQTSAPTGWTKITSSVDNKALRVVSGSVSSGGNQAFTSAFASRTPAGNVGSSGNSTASFSGSVSGNTGNSGASTSNVNTGGNVNNHTLSNNQMPSHSHSTSFRNKQDYGSNQGDGTRQWENANSSYNIGTNNSGGSGSHSHGFSGSGHSHNVNNHTHSFSANFSGNTGNHTHNAGSFSGTAMDFAVQYLDVIICSKD